MSYLSNKLAECICHSDSDARVKTLPYLSIGGTSVAPQLGIYYELKSSFLNVA